jgi:hypothetical protein
LQPGDLNTGRGRVGRGVHYERGCSDFRVGPCADVMAGRHLPAPHSAFAAATDTAGATNGCSASASASASAGSSAIPSCTAGAGVLSASAAPASAASECVSVRAVSTSDTVHSSSRAAATVRRPNPVVLSSCATGPFGVAGCDAATGAAAAASVHGPSAVVGVRATLGAARRATPFCGVHLWVRCGRAATPARTTLTGRSGGWVATSSNVGVVRPDDTGFALAAAAATGEHTGAAHALESAATAIGGQQRPERRVASLSTVRPVRPGATPAGGSPSADGHRNRGSRRTNQRCREDGLNTAAASSARASLPGRTGGTTAATTTTAAGSDAIDHHEPATRRQHKGSRRGERLDVPFGDL